MRTEPLIGALAGVIVVGYFTSTEPALVMCLILGGVFLAFAVQILVVSGQQLAEDRHPLATVPSTKTRLLAYTAASLAVVQTLLSMWMLVFAGNLFSLFGVLCGLCFTVAAVRALKMMHLSQCASAAPINDRSGTSNISGRRN